MGHEDAFPRPTLNVQLKDLRWDAQQRARRADSGRWGGCGLAGQIDPNRSFTQREDFGLRDPGRGDPTKVPDDRVDVRARTLAHHTSRLSRRLLQ